MRIIIDLNDPNTRTQVVKSYLESQGISPKRWENFTYTYKGTGKDIGISRFQVEVSLEEKSRKG